MKILIYKIKCPLTSKIKYVGKTVNLKRRIYQHTCKSSRIKNRHLSNWISKIIDENGLFPIFEIIEECDENNWSERETYWISYYRSKYKICNYTDGGEGCHGRKMSLEHRQIISKAQKGKKKNYKCLGGIKFHTLESKNKISKAKMGNKNAKGVNRTTEQKENLRLKLTNTIILNKESGIFHFGLNECVITYGLNKYTLSNYLTGKRVNKTNLIYV